MFYFSAWMHYKITEVAAKTTRYAITEKDGIIIMYPIVVAVVGSGWKRLEGMVVMSPIAKNLVWLRWTYEWLVSHPLWNPVVKNCPFLHGDYTFSCSSACSDCVWWALLDISEQPCVIAIEVSPPGHCNRPYIHREESVDCRNLQEEGSWWHINYLHTLKENFIPESLYACYVPIYGQASMSIYTLRDWQPKCSNPQISIYSPLIC